jgi:hypothetical protein
VALWNGRTLALSPLPPRGMGGEAAKDAAILVDPWNALTVLEVLAVRRTRSLVSLHGGTGGTRALRKATPMLGSSAWTTSPSVAADLNPPRVAPETKEL